MSLNQKRSTHPYCSDIIIKCFDHCSKNTLIASTSHELYGKLKENCKIVSDDVVFYHENYQMIFMEIKRSRKKRRRIKKIIIPQKLLGDKRIVLLLVSNWAGYLQKAHYELLNDFDVVLAAVTRCGSCLKYLPANHPFLNDPQIGFQAVKSYANCFRYLSTNLKNDRRIVLRAVMSNLDCTLLPLNFRNDREIVLNLLKKQGYQMTDMIHEDFLDDSEIILKTRNFYSDIIYRISSRLRNDVNFIMDYTKINRELGFKKFPSKFQEDFEFVKKLAKSHLPLAGVPEQWRSNLEIVKICIRRNPFELYSAPLSVWENKAFLLEIAPFAGEAMFSYHRYFSHQYSLGSSRVVEFDSEFILQVISLNPIAFMSLSQSFMNRENALLAIERNSPRCVLHVFSESLLKDRELVITSLKIPQDSNNHLYALPAAYRADKEIIKLALKLGDKVTTNLNIAAFVSDSLLEDGEFIKEILEINPSLKNNILLRTKHFPLCNE